MSKSKKMKETELEDGVEHEGTMDLHQELKKIMNEVNNV